MLHPEDWSPKTPFVSVPNCTLSFEIVTACRMAYGGMGPVTKMATTAASTAVGLSWAPGIVDTVCASIASDLPLPLDAPGGMVEFRRALATSFFFKFFLTVSAFPKGRFDTTFLRLKWLQYKLLTQYAVSPPHLGCQVCRKIGSVHFTPADDSATHPHVRPQSKGRVDWEEPLVGAGGIDAVGQPIPHLAGERHTTGEARYLDDTPPHPQELHGALVLSTVAHGNLLSVDPAPALAMPGVHAYYGADDVPGDNATGPIIHDEVIFAKGKVTCIGQAIGIVLADTASRAREAAKAVAVEYEMLTPVISIEDAIAADSYHRGERSIERGDPEAAIKAAAHVIEGEMQMGGQEHFYLEPQGCIAVPGGEEGEMDIFSSTQNPRETQVHAALALGVPANRINCRVKRMGGGFGGKETRSLYVSNAVAVAAAVSGRPVRCILEREDDMVSSGGRHPFLARYKVGCGPDGKILAVIISMYSNAGNSNDLSSPVSQSSWLNFHPVALPHTRTLVRASLRTLDNTNRLNGR